VLRRRVDWLFLHRRLECVAMTDLAEVFLGAKDALVPSDAVAALLILDDGRYIMQLRDLKTHIFYPGHWGLFGGAVDPGETDIEALHRELHEELGFEAPAPSRFVALDFDLTAIGCPKVYRAVYEVPVTREQFASFKLREGRACEALTAREVLTELKVTPYDSFAIWLHHARSRFVPNDAAAQS